MMGHPPTLQLRNLQTLVDLGVDKNSTVVFPAPLMSTINELTDFLRHESAAARSDDTLRPTDELFIAPRDIGLDHADGTGKKDALSST